ncbi:hypothetical protein CYV19_03740 [Natronobacterium gregoryi SP2]|uniref:Uncharacterized protein n=1 Tax=Natronobacterium gregoryi (strain ATCC 43098 / DSM 3393 / CCM 3738 / CIP 104747 / IAM 13177 / JCM 8860 / NBRC 102187 / NCIMB 2189 / SP2) TaxID=797304 RepID=A0A2J4JHP0_NATGS|nr:hypothetical protein CYV19_03740 [Natronobacterium gregoryi SP2]
MPFEPKTESVAYTAGQNDVTIGRSAGAVTGGDGRESATDFVLISVRQYYRSSASKIAASPK